MEGAGHRELRTALTGLLGPAYVTGLVRRSAGGPLAELAADLRAGAPVDLAARVRALVGAVLLGLVGVRLPAPECAALIRRGESLTAMIGPRTRRLTPAQAEHGRQVLAAGPGPRPPPGRPASIPAVTTPCRAGCGGPGSAGTTPAASPGCCS